MLYICFLNWFGGIFILPAIHVGGRKKYYAVSPIPYYEGNVKKLIDNIPTAKVNMINMKRDRVMKIKRAK